MKETDIILFEYYLSDQMSREERVAFEARLASDVEMKADYDLYKSMDGYVESTAEKGAALDVLREIGREKRSDELNDSGRLQEEKNKTIITRKKWKWVFVGIALLVVSIFYLSNTSHETPTYAELYVEPSWPIERSGDRDNIAEAIAIYLSGDYRKASRLLSAINTDDSRYWLAEIHAKEMAGDSVLKYLPINLDDKIRRDRANYLKIIALVGQGKEEEAKRVVAALPLDTDEWYLGVYSKLR